jgi:putative ABC transport system permease protein
MIGDYFLLGIKDMDRRRLRSYLTIIGIIIGIASIIALVSISQGLENAITEQFEKMGIKDIRVAPKGLRGPPVGNEVLTTKDVETVENIIGVDYVNYIILSYANVEFNNEKKFTQVIAYSTDNIQKSFADIDLGFDEGRNLKKGEKGSMLIGYNTAHKLFDKDIRLRNTVKVNNEKFKVVGVFEKQGNPQIDNSIYIPIEQGRIIFEKPEEISIMFVHIKEGYDINEMAEKIRKKLKRARNNENFQVITPKEILNQLNTILGIVELVLVGIAAISLLVGGIGIMNAMYTSVLERTREIGVMKSIGAKNSTILLIFLIESGMIGLVGGIIGAVLGTLFALSFGSIATQMGFSLLLIKVEWQLILFVLAFAFFVGVLSGTLPAIRASKLQPAEALRYE